MPARLALSLPALPHSSLSQTYQIVDSDDSIYLLRMRYLISLLLLLLSYSSIAQESLSLPPVVRDDGWPVALLASVGFDMEKMQQLDHKLESGIYTNVHMVVERDLGNE